MSGYNFAEVNGLAGGMALGYVQNGFRLVHRCGTLSLGAENVRGNRTLMGWDWEDEFSDNYRSWHIPNDEIHVVTANPPCSGYSTITNKNYRGQDAAVNKHMNASAAYAGRVKPLIYAYESVQQIYTSPDGRDHLRKLRFMLEEATGHSYDLYHVLHNVCVLGGCSQRKRYFAVFSRVPFGIDPPTPTRVPTLNEAIGDLEGLVDTWERQPYRRPENWWSSRRRSPDHTVDGHATRKLKHSQKMQELFDALHGWWPQGAKEADAVKYIYERDGSLPPLWKPSEERLVTRKFDMGPQQTVRWHGDRPARVLMGSALDAAIHPTELRLFTLREAMRIQGFPDNWKLAHLQDVATAPLFPGKGVSVDAGRWIGYWTKQALDGRPGSMRGTPDGEREFVFNSTNNHKLAPIVLGRRPTR